ncbi:patatin-like phospholipase family protein [Pseudoduganella sp. RAF19]|uniref:patatin-like phospholipase family protein n=2 Tax=unclassified Pseudoduganella TaxID=2637179 RepID=UPI003F945468
MSSKKLKALTGALLFVSLVLFALQQALRLPAGYGVEDFMGWTNPGAVKAALYYWDKLPAYHHAERWYVWIDTLVFIPIYASLILGVTRKVFGKVARHWWNRVAELLAYAALILLACYDLAENATGLARMYWGEAPLFLSNNADIFHSKKFFFISVAILPSAYAAVMWWLGIDSTAQQAQLRREKWQGMMGVIGRSRYVLAALLLFAGFTLFLDQCRDVVLGMVGSDSPLFFKVSAIALNALACALFAYSCWLWTRLVEQVKRCTLPSSSNADVNQWIGRFAQQWARLLSLMPALMLMRLFGYVTGDALAGLRMEAGTASEAAQNSLFWLQFFAFLVLALWGAFLWKRQKLALARPEEYYNSRDLPQLLKDEPSRVAGWQGKLAYFIGPTNLPLLALGLMLLIRVLRVTMPESFNAPFAFAELCLSLTWWLGVAGVVSLVEQKSSIPWGAFFIVLAGVFGVMQWTDNHQFSVAAAGAGNAGASSPALFLPAVLIGCLATTWIVFTKRYARREGSQNQGLALISCALGLGVVLVAVLWVAGRTAPYSPMLGVEKETRPTLQKVLDDHGLKGKPLYLVASEGGGIRSAYWTALMLAKLHEMPGFDERVLAISGVSGGAMGAAVYRACLRRDRTHVMDCVETGFRKLDALSPLVESLMLEDVVARVIPTSFCAAPGCGYMSRAIAFEQEWIEAFPEMAEPFGPARKGEPELLLNSTGVESGNRNTFSTMQLGLSDTPSNDDIITELKREPRLVTAAHAAARFPFINPLALVEDNEKARWHLADGGYYDNSGVTVLIDLVLAMQQNKVERKVKLILIRNGQIDASCGKKLSPDALVTCLKEVSERQYEGPLNVPLRRPGQALYADAVGPPTALFNVSGIGAHGRYPPGSSIWPKGTHCLLDQQNGVNLAPLGWYLSHTAREALRKQADKVAVASCLADSAEPAPASVGQIQASIQEAQHK